MFGSINYYSSLCEVSGLSLRGVQIISARCSDNLNGGIGIIWKSRSEHLNRPFGASMCHGLDGEIDTLIHFIHLISEILRVPYRHTRSTQRVFRKHLYHLYHLYFFLCFFSFSDYRIWKCLYSVRAYSEMRPNRGYQKTVPPITAYLWLQETRTDIKL